jgi:hypothetical protein
VRAAPVLVLLAVSAVVVAITALSDRSYDSDELFYEARVEELKGAPHIEDDPEHVVRVRDPAWVDYSDQFYRRRWVAPLLAAAADPVVDGDRLRVVSMAGYLLIGPRSASAWRSPSPASCCRR